MAKATKNLELKIGAMIISSLALLVAFVFMLGDFSFKERAVIYVDYPNTGQLKVGAPVRITGVKVGKIIGVELWGGKTDPKVKRSVMVRIKLRLFAYRLKQIHQDAKFFIATEGLLGEKYIEIAPGSLNKPPARPGEIFLGIPPMKVEDFAASADSILKELNSALTGNRKRIEDLLDDTHKLIKDVDGLILENRANIKKIVDNAAVSMANAKVITEHVRHITKQYNKIGDIVDNLQAVSKQLKGVGRVMNEAQKGMHDITQVITGVKTPLEQAARHTQDILTKINDFVAKINSGNNSISMLIKDKQLYWDLVEMIKDIKKHPWKLILKQ